VLVQDTEADPAAHVALADGTALATSSSVRRTWRRGTETAHHIVDPRTSRPARTPWRTVSVVAATCAEANTAATATVAKGLDGQAWLAAQGLPARLVDRDFGVHLLVALVMFTLSIVLGIVSRSGRPLPGLGRFGAADLHRSVALTGTGLVLAHVVSLFFDPYAQLRVVDFFVPFLGAAKPLWLGLGTLALDLLVVVTVVSLLRHRVGPRVFKSVHWATYLLWPISVAHGLGNGTDAHSPWMIGLVAACVGLVVGAVTWRLTPSFEGRGWARRPRTLAGRNGR
jgi:hypothetical protein